MTTIKVPAVPGLNRRQEFSASTKRDLVDVAEELFTEGGYAATSLDAIVAGARVTKGALYHHFSGKQDLFKAVCERLEERSAKEVEEAIRTHDDPWEQASLGLRRFLEIVREPGYRRIVIQEGPAVLGYERFREQEHLSTYSILRQIVSAVLGAGEWAVDEETLETFSRVFFGAINVGGAAVATSKDPEADSQRVEQALGVLITGLRLVIESGAPLDRVDPLAPPRS